MSNSIPYFKKQDIIDSLKNSAEKKKTPLIGIEAEKIGIRVPSGDAPKYTGKNGYLAILGKLYEELGWEITKQKDKFILQLKRGHGTIDLESDGRIELAGSPHESIHDLAREFRIHQNEIKEISKVFGIGWLGIGYHPLELNKNIESVPEKRKKLLEEYYTDIKEKTGNDFGLAHYKKTAGIHVNIDYTSEADFARKGKIFYRLSPLLNAIFANSPFSKKKFTGYMSYRSNICINTGIDRHSTPKDLYESDFSFEAWLRHVLSLEILFLNKENKWIKPSMSFDEYLEKGFEGYRADRADFDMHLKSCWKDIKMKEVIELRFFDSLPPYLVPSVAALVKGLAYNENALAKLEKITEDWSFYEYQELQQQSAKYGLEAEMKNRKLLSWARDLLEIAESSLKEVRIYNAYGHDESKYLEPIKEFIFVKGKSPAEWLVEKWESDWNKSFFPVLDWCQY